MKRKRTSGPEEEAREAVTDLILREIERSASHKDWQGAAETLLQPALNPPFQKYGFPASIDAKVAVQIVGQANGCHTCCTILTSDPDQPWVGDHCPLTELQPLARTLLGCSDKTYLFPQCHNRSQQHSALVSAFSRCKTPVKIKELVEDLTPYGLGLLTGGKEPIPKGTKGAKGWNCLRSTGPAVKVAEGYDIQTLGSAPGPHGGCHTCGSVIPVTEYVADHVVPAAFVTSSMKELFDHLEIEYPLLQLRPQCTRCSTAQGGQVQMVVKQALAYARSIGITVY